MTLQNAVTNIVSIAAGALLLGFGITTQADIAVEFGRGAEKLSKIDFGKPALSEREQVVVDFFDDEDLGGGRDLTTFACYEAELRDLESRQKRGDGIDCLGISPVFSEPLVGSLGPEHKTPGLPEPETALSPQIDAVTFFFFPDGYIVTDGFTTVRPIFDGVGDGLTGGAGPFGAITHITGSIPGVASNIVDASGAFEDLVSVGRVRLSGAVNTDSFFDDASIAFTCYFTIMEDEPDVGENVTFGKNCTPGVNFVAGDNVTIGKNCNIGDDVTIGSEVSIGKNVTIVDGVTIGSNVEVGKNANILADVPDNEVIPKNATYP